MALKIVEESMMAGKKRYPGVALVGLLACGFGVTATAQETPNDLEIGLFARGEYDDNLLRLSREEKDARPDLSPSDQILAIGTDVSFRKRLGLQSLELQARADYRFHDNNDQFDREALYLASTLDWRFGTRCSGDAGYSLSRDNNQFETFDDLIKNQQNEHQLSFFSQCLLGPRLALTAGVDTVLLNNAVASRRINDRDEWGVRGGLRLLTVADGYFGVFASFRNRKFPNRIVLPSLAAEENDQIYLAFEASRNIGGRFQTSVSVGYSEVEDKLDSNAKFSGLNGDLNVVYAVGSRLSVQGDIHRNVSNSSSLSVPYTINSGFGLAADYDLSPRMNFSAGGGWDHESFGRTDQTGGFVIEQPQSSDRYYLEARATYQAVRLVGVELGVRYYSRNSPLSTFEYSSSSVFLALRARWD